MRGFLDRQHAERVAVADATGSCTYGELLAAATGVAAELLEGAEDLAQTRVAFLVTPDRSYVHAQWGIWLAGGVAVPLCTSHPRPELVHVIEDCGAESLISDEAHADRLVEIAAERGLRMLSINEVCDTPAVPLPDLDPGRRAMIVYTSGTTGRPKGVVTTHRNLAAQIECLVEAWEWSRDDRILNVLPLHHVHGIVNVVACALWSGAVCEMAPGFDAVAVWERIERGGVTLFMAVPTIYQRLIETYDAAPAEKRQQWSEAIRDLRLMVSGSAALPVRVLERWREITGHVLLERYGMTELGMALSNPLHGERRPGSVGTPLPGVDVRLIDGEIQVRGPGVFQEYWQLPDASGQAFDGGWFMTGDAAVIEDGHYRILGRRSVDILKTGGEKVSALEIEEILREHDHIEECAVVGIPDPEWGQRVAVAVVLREGCELDLAGLRAWAKQQLAPYKVPSRLLCLEQLPRNALGKVTKPNVVALFRAD